MIHGFYVCLCITFEMHLCNTVEPINRIRVNGVTQTDTQTQHRHVVHDNCLTVWSNSKWICDLSIDFFSPRLWIKCFNYWCTYVRCLLECCMWCRPLSPGKLLPPTHPQPTPTPPPHRHPFAPPSWRPYLAWMNTLQASCRQASTNWTEVNAKIKSVSLYRPPLPPPSTTYCNTHH